MITKESKIASKTPSISIIIVTYFRGPYLVDTIRLLQAQQKSHENIYVIDQTPEYSQEIEQQLEKWNQQEVICWHRLSKPSIVNAMNYGLVNANSDIVLFLDDDIIPTEQLVNAHRDAYSDKQICGVVGQVLQPGETATAAQKVRQRTGIYKDLEFKFNGSAPAQVENVMGGNLSVDRQTALRAGGFDANFVGVAYRFETEFAKRLVRHSGKKICFEPDASVKHLQAPSGGTRKYGNPLSSASPDHSVGDYYYALRCASGLERYIYMATRAFRAIRTRFHLRHPWWIPVKLVGEFRGILLAKKLASKGPKLISSAHQDHNKGQKT